MDTCTKIQLNFSVNDVNLERFIEESSIPDEVDDVEVNLEK